MACFDLDKLGSKTPLNLPSATKTFSSNSTLRRVRELERDMTNVPNSLKERVASVLASEFSKKVGTFKQLCPMRILKVHGYLADLVPEKLFGSQRQGRAEVGLLPGF